MTVCKKCGSDKNVVQHHIKYQPEKTVMLCASCHGKAHSHDDHEYAPEQEMPNDFTRDSSNRQDMTTIALSKDAKKKAEKAKYKRETWNEYIQRCTAEGPEIVEYVAARDIELESDSDLTYDDVKAACAAAIRDELGDQLR